MQQRTRALGVTALLALTLLVAACGGGDDDSATDGSAAVATAPAQPSATRPVGAASPVAAAATAPATGTGGADAVFNNYKTQFAAVKSYRMDTQVETQGQRMQMVIDVQLPDRYKVTMTGGPVPVDLVAIGNQTYIKAGPTWQLVPGTGPASLPIQPSQLAVTIQGVANSPNVTKGATMTVAGASCTVYTVTTPQSQKADICIGSDSLPRQVKYTDAANTMTVTYSMFGANFNIVAPI